MPNLIIDDMAVEVAAGTRVIDAAEQLGIMIPRFCYLKALGAVGACRMCAVLFIAGPVKGVEMSCMVEARDGMVVSTSAPEAVDFRRQVIEWLMANHPHDCPVCDEGGQCLLQDETVSGGHGTRHYPGRKRTYRDQHLGPLIQQEMNRCIHCYRCARFYQEYAGYHDFGVLQIGNRLFYGRFEDGPLENPFAGNLVDICPTGVFTDKPARYRARRWDMQRAPSLCIHCGIGCSTIANGFHQEIIRQEARENRLVNGSFICDRGRFGCFYANHPDRPWRPRVRNKEVDWGQAMDEAEVEIQRILVEYGPQALVFLGSGRTSLETIVMLEQASRRLGTAQPHYFTDPQLEYRIRRATARLDGQLAISLGEIEDGDCILVVGVDPINESPMLVLALRQAVRKGAIVAVIDPRPVSMPFEFYLLSAVPAEIPDICSVLVHQAFDQQAVSSLDGDARDFYDSLSTQKRFDAVSEDKSCRIVKKIAACKRPVIICGTSIVHNTLPDFAANLARLIYGIKGQCGLYYVFPGPDDFGTVLLGKVGNKSFPDLLDAVENDEIKGLIVVESDPFHSFCDRKRLDTALAKLELLICLDYLPTELSGRSHILCPTATHFETGSHFVNHEGLLQYAKPVHGSSRPLSQVTGGKHPLRDFARNGDKHDPRPAWQILQDISNRVTGEKVDEDIQALLRQQMMQRGYPDNGRMLPQKNAGSGYHFTFPDTQGVKADDEAMELILTEWIFGTEELSSYSGPSAGADKDPLVMMHIEDAERGGLNNGDMVIMHLDRGILQLRLETSAGMAGGCVILPRHRDLEWQQLKYQQEKLPLCRIERA